MTTHTATVPALTMHAAASLVPFAATGREATMSPTIGTVALSLAGQEFRAVATDRFVVGDYAMTLPEEFTGELPQLMVNTKDMAAIAKATPRTVDRVTLTHDDEAGTLTVEHAAGSMRVETFRGNFPPVARLFGDEQGPMHPGTLMLNVEFLAKLAKVKHPVTGKAFAAVQPWEFGQVTDTYRSGKPLPVYASVSLDGGHTFRALIQPNVKLR